VVSTKEEGSGKKEEPRGFRRLVAWQKADELASAVFRGLDDRRVPSWLVSQAARSAVSVPANIAEGYARGSLRDYLRFLDIAHGSLAELEYYLHFMVTNDLLDAATHERLSRLSNDAGNVLIGLIRPLRAKLKDGSWDRTGIAEDSAEYSTAASLPPSSDLLPGEDE
jgi:four helix bundle protein